MNMNVIQIAKRYALDHHGKQCRPNASEEPIGVHLAEVSSYVIDEGVSESVVAAAWLHDVVEDTEVTLDMIGREFGEPVRCLVAGLTDPKDFSALPLEKRKPRQAKRLATLTDDVKIIKLADQISNLKSVIFDPPLDWDSEKCLRYIQGATSVANVCQGLSKRLDDLVLTYRNVAAEKYGL